MLPGSRSGATYVRWGRNTCPASAELVFRGFIGGKHYNVEGGGTNNLCLPSDPTWLKYVDGNDGTYRGYVYGSEIDNGDADNIFDYAVNDQDVPCAVCRTQKASALMIPARKDCYKDWTFEYNGYIMGANSRFHGSYNYICMDHQPEFLQHGGTNDDQHILYLQEAQCGSLPCPPYVQGRELACVVCTK